MHWQYRASGYTPAEDNLVGRPRLTSGSLRPVVRLHGLGGDDLQILTSPNTQKIMRELADTLGLLFVAPDVTTVAQPDGANTWGNAASKVTMEAAVAYAQGLVGGNSATKVLLWGGSGGFITAAAYAKDHPSVVAGILGTIPGTDIDTAYGDARFTATIDAAYGGSWATNGGDAFDPINFAPTALAGIKQRLYYATDDGTVPPSGPGSAINYAAACGANAQAIAMGTGDHTDVPLGNIDVQALIRWIQTLTY